MSDLTYLWRIVRYVLILSFGALVLKFAYGARYESSPFDGVIWLVFGVISLILFIVALVKDRQEFGQERRWVAFVPSLLCLLIAASCVFLVSSARRTLDRPSLLRAFYNGDFNGLGLDLKTDGTFIFDDAAIGFSEYSYGKYELDGHTVRLIPNDKDNERVPRLLEIRSMPDGAAYLVCVDSSGQEIKGELRYRVTVDAR